MNGSAGVKTFWKFTLRGPDGTIKYEGPVIPNTISETGLAAMHAAILAPSGRPNVFQYIAIGTNNTAPAAVQTALLGEVNRQPAAETDLAPTGSTQSILRVSFGPGEGVGMISEAGLFNAASGGVMLARVLQGVVDKTALDTLDIEVQFNLAEAV